MDDRIVVGVDGSPASRAALRWAVEEGGLRGVAVDAVLAWHVDYPVVIGPMSAAVAAGLDREVLRGQAQAVLADLVADVAGDVRPVLTEGDARDVLVEASREAALLVVGSRGAGPVRRVLLGSVSSHCVHHAACPVVVLRQSETKSESSEVES
ncbi:universal stress protein [Saccharothrix coeruleofusca]|uniref:Universal stress protein n=1 Tax=Saccharothrix coeruleofusca TaxID=33919 RepID=A0A918EHF4_9PSEU|nr:universal stress protein [Saccharothrix coeruleofusca]MBP2335718.1 nucleotide-binding universal stress UspA family protein [Saccharothrix coeruleofusca]GGP75572.1 universal stress protein [Saccharothrix coeruleofusca]